jgi:hypothetical protein
MAIPDLGMPMQGNYLRQLPPNASLQEITAAMNDIIARLNGMLKTQVFSDGNNKRMLLASRRMAGVRAKTLVSRFLWKVLMLLALLTPS